MFRPNVAVLYRSTCLVHVYYPVALYVGTALLIAPSGVTTPLRYRCEGLLSYSER
jgi:hypothetical protein